MLRDSQPARSRSCVRHRPRVRHGPRATPARRPRDALRRSGRSTGSTLRSAPRSASARTNCSTTCRATPRCRRRSTRSRHVRRGHAGFANAVLRALTRLGPPWPEPPSDAVALSYPDWLVERLARDLGDDDAHAALVAMNEPAAMTLRPNPREATADALEAELRRAGVNVERGAARSRRAHRARRRRSRRAARGTRRTRDAAGPGESGARRCPRPAARRTASPTSPPHPGARPPPSPSVSVPTVRSSRSTSTPVVCGWSPKRRPARSRLVSTPSSPTDARLPLAGRALRSGAPRRAVQRSGRACGGARTHAGASTSRRSASWPRCNATCSVRRPRSCDPVACSSTRCAPSRAPRPSTSTSGPSSTSTTSTPAPPPGAPWQPLGRGALLLPQAAGTDGMFVLALRNATNSVGPIDLIDDPRRSHRSRRHRHRRQPRHRRGNRASCSRNAGHACCRRTCGSSGAPDAVDGESRRCRPRGRPARRGHTGAALRPRGGAARPRSTSS